MAYIVSVTLLTLPFLLCYVYSMHEYGFSIRDNLKKWKLGKYLGIILYIGYVYHLLFSGYITEYLTKDLVDIIFYFIEPSISITLIVFSKPASEILINFKPSLKSDLQEDMAFIFGWIGLVHVISMTAIEWYSY